MAGKGTVAKDDAVHSGRVVRRADESVSRISKLIDSGLLKPAHDCRQFALRRQNTVWAKIPRPMPMIS
jgi:hypothetical protein